MKAATRSLVGGARPYAVALSAIRTALTGAGSTAVDIVTLGDSITEGTGASAIGNTWTHQLVSALRTRYQPGGVTGGVGFQPGGKTSGITFTAAWTGYASPAYSTTNLASASAPAGVAYSLAAGGTMTATITATSFKLWYRNGFSTFSPFSVVIDGGAANNVTPTQTGSFRDNGVWTSSALAAGSHTVVVTNTGANPLNVLGIQVFNGDESTGVRSVIGGHAVWKSSDMATIQGNGNAPSFLTAIAPKLVVIYLGINDYTQGVAASTYQTNISTLLTEVKSATSGAAPSIILCGQYQRTATGVTVVDPYTSYKAAAKAVADADPTRCAYIDLDALFGFKNPDVDASSGYWDADKVHPSNSGHAVIGAAIAALI